MVQWFLGDTDKKQKYQWKFAILLSSLLLEDLGQVALQYLYYEQFLPTLDTFSVFNAVVMVRYIFSLVLKLRFFKGCFGFQENIYIAWMRKQYDQKGKIYDMVRQKPLI